VTNVLHPEQYGGRREPLHCLTVVFQPAFSAYKTPLGRPVLPLPASMVLKTMVISRKKAQKAAFDAGI
jgi:urea transporter